MNRAVRRLGSLQIALRPGYFFLGAPNRCIRAGQFRLQFGNLENRQRLSRVHVRSHVDVNCLDVTGHFRVHIHVLEWLERAGERQRRS